MWSLRILLIIFSFNSIGCLDLAAARSFSINYADMVTVPKGEDITILSPHAKIYGNKSQVHAYISLTELSRSSPLVDLLQKEDIVSENTSWSSYLAHIDHPSWRMILEKELNLIIERGYQNIFIDTVDGVETLCQKNKERCNSYRDAALELIQLMRRRIPGTIITNRGFFIYPDMKDFIQGVLIESFFYGKEKGGYRERTEEEMKWLTSWVERLKNDGKFILTVDYADNLSSETQVDLRKKADQFGVSWRLDRESLQY